MHDQTLTEQVRQIMADTFGIDQSELPDSASQANFARWTSILHMVLLVALEEQFEITLSMEEMTTMTSLERILDVLHQKLAIGLNA
jgi:acyl carrier protein